LVHFQTLTRWLSKTTVVLALLSAATLPGGCSAPSKGALILAISTDMQTPKDIDVVSVYITTNGAPKFNYMGRVLPDGTVSLPSTLAIVEPDAQGAEIRVRVIAFQTQPSGDASARVLRDVLTTVPHQRTALLRVPLSFLDDGSGMGKLPSMYVPRRAGGTPDGDTKFDPTTIDSTCNFDQTQKTEINGACTGAVVDSSLLPSYAPTEVYGDGGLQMNGAVTGCFDVSTCLAGAVPVQNPSMSSCSFTLAQGALPPQNLALATQSTGVCVAGGKCFVPLENDPTDGWSVSGSTVQMIPGICNALMNGAQLYEVTSGCAPLTPSQPVCEPVGADAGAPEAGQPDAGPTSDAPLDVGAPDGGATDATVGGPDATAPTDATSEGGTVSPPPWGWVNGPNVGNGMGVYGTQGTPSPTNVPGSRNYAVSWTDSTGNFWLFGGYGSDSTGAATFGYLNDLWEYSAGQWTWVSGSNVITQKGIYGAQGMPSPTNVPGSRNSSISWTDSTGNLWLFGGYGYDSVGTAGSLNDLWEYSGGAWTWVSGSSLASQKGIYGVQGMPSPTNVPGGRTGAVSWMDATGNLWLFGGNGWDSGGTIANLNDLWEYSAGAWTWVSGSNVVSQNGVYGTQGMSSPTNVPGCRTGAVSWIDSGGNLWLFGGTGNDSTGASGSLNDLWEYSGGAWTWVNGANIVAQSGVYGTQGTPSPVNVPGARSDAFHWIDSAGTFWLFGGNGYDSLGTTGAYLNDLWKYSGGQWTWVSGSSVGDKVGTYGTQGTPSPTNVPGGRGNGVSWRDSAGNLWLFGGYGYDSTGISFLNDLWQVGVVGNMAAAP
jgi:hypothetical protein